MARENVVINVLNKMDEERVAWLDTGLDVYELLDNLRRREKEVYEQTGCYVTSSMLLQIIEGLDVKTSWEGPEVQKKYFGGKSNPAKYLIGLAIAKKEGTVMLFVPFMNQKEGYLAWGRGVGDAGILEVVRDFSARFNKQLDKFVSDKSMRASKRTVTS